MKMNALNVVTDIPIIQCQADSTYPKELYSRTMSNKSETIYYKSKKKHFTPCEILQCKNCSYEWAWWPATESYTNKCIRCNGKYHIYLCNGNFYVPDGTLLTYNEQQIH